MREEGDGSVGWVDCSGWVDGGNFVALQGIDGRGITYPGHAKIAAALSLHLCTYLAEQPLECPFLPPAPYQGPVYDDEMERLGVLVEAEMVRGLRDAFGV